MKRVIRFTEADFDGLFESYGIDPETITPSEWWKFQDMFIEGTSWFEVAKEAAYELMLTRKGET